MTNGLLYKLHMHNVRQLDLADRWFRKTACQMLEPGWCGTLTIQFEVLNGAIEQTRITTEAAPSCREGPTPPLSKGDAA